MDHYDRQHMSLVLGILVVFILGCVLIYFNSKGDYATEQHKAKGECVEFLMKSDGWNYNLVEIRDC